MKWCVALLLFGCGKSDPPPAPAPAPAPIVEQKPAPPPPPAPARARMHAEWTKIRSESTCWYFSGPSGRDDRLSGDISFHRDGDRVTATIGGATFTGTYRDNVLDLARKSRHSADGTWNVDETIKGDYIGGKVIARYHYEECLVGTPCPNHCKIEAMLAFTL